MSDIVVTPKCPQCGQDLHIEQLHADPAPDDRVYCPEHGTVGSREAVTQKMLDDHGDEIRKQAAEFRKRTQNGAGRA